MADENKGVFGGETAHLPVAGVGPVDVRISVYGAGGAVGYNPPGSATIEYFDPVQGKTVERSVPIGGGYSNTIVTVRTGSLISTEQWTGEVRA